MRHTRRYLIPVIVLCALVSQACGGDKIREARKAAYRIQVVTDAAVDTTTTLFHDGVIDKARTNQIAKALLKVNSGNKVLIDKAEAATADTPGVRADLIAQLKVVEDAVKELKATGVLGIKSKDGSLAFDSAISALDSAVAIIQVALAGVKK
jgi:hypothetical protein